MSMTLSSIPAIASNPNWLELSKEITLNIIQRLEVDEILTSARNVCPYWWNICKDPLMWRTISMTDIHMLRYNSSNLSKICCYAVDKSCGGLEDISIKYFGNDDLLKYVADRASQLRHLKIEDCQRSLSKEGLIEAVKKFPLLEELHISKCHLLHTVSFYVIGQSCRLLKSLKLHSVFDETKACDDQAFGIAQTMPGLRHLEILENNLSNDGLLAILDGCPLLESLHVRGCLHLDLCGSIGRRCKKQIKDRCPPSRVIDKPDDTCGDIRLAIRRLRSITSDLLQVADFSHLKEEYEMGMLDDSLVEY